MTGCLYIYIFNSNPALTAKLFTFFFLLQLGIDPSNGSIPHSAVLTKVAEWARNNNNNDQSDSLQFDVVVFIRR